MNSPDLLKNLEAAWEANWSSTPPLGFLLRAHHEDRWVRFHSLPESKRYATTAAEAATVLQRHHTLLDELGGTGEYVVLWASFPSDPLPMKERRRQANAIQWRTVLDDDYLAEPAKIYANVMRYPSEDIDDLLGAAANDELPCLIIGPLDLSWLYHPYDGGADVIARSSSERDKLKKKFSSWLSRDPTGV